MDGDQFISTQKVLNPPGERVFRNSRENARQPVQRSPTSFQERFQCCPELQPLWLSVLSCLTLSVLAPSPLGPLLKSYLHPSVCLKFKTESVVEGPGPQNCLALVAAERATLAVPEPPPPPSPGTSHSHDAPMRTVPFGYSQERNRSCYFQEREEAQ